MFKFFQKVKKSRVGYTLTELIVVVAILGILAAIGIPLIMNAVGDARTSADETSITTIEGAVQICMADGTLAWSNAATPLIIVSPTAPGGTTIAGAIRARLVGNQYPINNTLPENAANRRVWHLELTTGSVDTAAFAANDQPLN